MLASGLGSLSACHKEGVDADGAIRATILPAGYVTQVTATDAAAHVYTATPDVVTGQVRFPNLPAGAYSVAVLTKLAYKAPAVQQTQVTAGQITRLSYYTLTRDTQVRGTVTWTENGTRYSSASLFGEVSNSVVSVNGTASANGISRQVAFMLPVRQTTAGLSTPVFTGLGTYALGGKDQSFGQCTRTNGTDVFSWHTPTTGASTGRVTITQYDPTAFTLAGTFAFTAQAITASTGTPTDLTITDGAFSITY